MALLVDLQAKSHYIKKNTLGKEGILEKNEALFAFPHSPKHSPGSRTHALLNISMWPLAAMRATYFKTWILVIGHTAGRQGPHEGQMPLGISPGGIERLGRGP